MKQEKFIAVLAVLDKKSQDVLRSLQDTISLRFGGGTETHDVPFHITLGSFSVKDKVQVLKDVKRVIGKFNSFEVEYEDIGNFGSNVLFAKPKVNDSIITLHKLFNNNFADGFDYYPHTTLYMSDDITPALDLIKQSFKPFKARVVGIYVGEFFPTNKLFYGDFLK